MKLPMTIEEIACCITMIFVADLLCEGVMHYIKKWRKKAANRVICEMCQKPRKIKLSKDGQIKACTKCRKLYVESLKQEAVNGTS